MRPQFRKISRSQSHIYGVRYGLLWTFVMDDKMWCELCRLSECDALRQDCFCNWSQKTDNGHQKSKISGRIKFLYFISFKLGSTGGVPSQTGIHSPIHISSQQMDGDVDWPSADNEDKISRPRVPDSRIVDCPYIHVDLPKSLKNPIFLTDIVSAFQ